MIFANEGGYTIPAAFLLPLVAGLFLFGGGLVLKFLLDLSKYQKLQRGEPERRNVTITDSFATRTELEMVRGEMRRELANLQVDLKELGNELRDDGKARETAIFGRINEVHAEMTQKIEALPHQIVALLMNTRNLNK